MRERTREIAFVGILIAMSVVLTRFASIRIAIGGIEGVRIGFGTFPIILSGILFGPVLGALTGALADIIGFALSPMGPYFPHFTLTASLYGILPGILVHFPLRSRTYRIFLAVVVPQIGVGCLLTPYFLHTLFDMPWKVLLIPRLISTPLNVLFYVLLLFSLSRVPLFAALREQ
ncbi:MAG: folate family ECF transporter S component [Atribacterota bacterium]